MKSEYKITLDEETVALIRLALEVKKTKGYEEQLKGIRCQVSIKLEEIFEELPF